MEESQIVNTVILASYSLHLHTSDVNICLFEYVFFDVRPFSRLNILFMVIEKGTIIFFFGVFPIIRHFKVVIQHSTRQLYNRNLRYGCL